MAVTVELADDIDISRGDMLVRPGNLPHLSDQFEANLVWMDEKPLAVGRPYHIKMGTSTARAVISRVRHRFDMEHSKRVKADSLELNGIGRVHLELTKKLSYDPYSRNRSTGAFVLIDLMTNGTVGAGMIIDRRVADEVEEHPAERPLDPITPAARAARLGHGAAIIWIEGDTMASARAAATRLERALFQRRCLVAVVERATSEEAARADDIAEALANAGLITIVATPHSVPESMHEYDAPLISTDSGHAPGEILTRLVDKGIIGET
jgi:sulfate adenylyltransferase subunit 1 (EFTu-like GTPase family)